jgi:hypothetical protein
MHHNATIEHQDKNALQRTAQHDYVIMEHHYINGRSALPVVTAIWKCLIEVLTYTIVDGCYICHYIMDGQGYCI